MKPTLVFLPHSPFAWPIYHIAVFVVLAMSVILLLVLVLVFYVSWRYKAKPDAETPTPNYGNLPVELAYTIAPTLLLGVIFVFTVHTMSVSDPPTGGRADDIEVIGHQWWWEFHYRDAGFITANEVHIPINTKLLFGMESADVIHDFWVPELGRKMDMIPGRHGDIWLSADQPGIYSGACAEFCGAEHAWMRIQVIAQSQKNYDRWLRQQQQTSTPPTSDEAAAGLEYFLAMSCANCHTIRGTSAQGKIGPDLTHIASREKLATGRLENNPEQLYLWLHQPDVYKPGSHMPNLHLSAHQLHDMVAYLETLQ